MLDNKDAPFLGHRKRFGALPAAANPLYDRGPLVGLTALRRSECVTECEAED
jgi:hypothetical protein